MVRWRERDIQFSNIWEQFRQSFINTAIFETVKFYVKSETSDFFQGYTNSWQFFPHAIFLEQIGKIKLLYVWAQAQKFNEMTAVFAGQFL